jgi:small-conductance mechanosensitive channel
MQESMQDILTTEFLNNLVADYLFAGGVLILGIVAIAIVKQVILQRIKRWVVRDNVTLDGALLRIMNGYLFPLAYLGLAYLTITSLTLSLLVRQIVNVVSLILLTVLVVRFLGALVEYGIRFYVFSQRERSPNLESSISALAPAIKILFWSIGVIFLLDNFGLDITAIVASLGIGGVAIALASQGVLQDLFSYFSILFDRPFEIGDFIMVDENLLGSIEQIGIKSTKVRSLSGEQLVLANSDLTSTRIRNFKRMERRRVVFPFGVTYETGLAELAAIPELVREIIESTENTVFDRAHFAAFGDFSLDFEVVYYVTTSDYNAYMNAQQRINLELKRVFAERQIEFAYPTQVTYLTPAAKAASNGTMGAIAKALAVSAPNLDGQNPEGQNSDR